MAQVGHIRIVGTLGTGGMGEVYAGWDETLQRRVALKAIRRKHRMRPEVQGRFLREARVLSQLDHPNICRIYDFVAGTDRDFLVLELIEGENLAAAIRRGLDGPRRLEIAEQIADAVATAHGKGVVHRDLKPANVMLTESGEVKVLDFGIARSVATEGAGQASGDAAEAAPGGVGTETDAPVVGHEEQETALQHPVRLWSDDEWPESAEPGPSRGSGASASSTVQGTVLGSPAYLSPEQARGEPATTASDMYSFGLLLHELFTGSPPHPGGIGVEELVRRARQAETLSREGVRSDVAALISRLLEPAAAARPTAVEVLGRLRWIRDRPRRRLIRGAVAAALVVLLLGGLKYTWDLKAARDVAERHREQAEDLIGFMLGDLRDKLAAVGRLELLEDVGDKALDYYESLPAEARTEAELFRRSEALRQIGEVRIAQGDLPAAMEAFEESERLAQALVEREPVRHEWLLGLGHSHFWKGNVHWLQGDLPAARERFESYRELTDRLVAADPGETQWRLEQGYAVTNLAAVHEALGEPDEAFAALRLSLTIKEDLVRSDPASVEWRTSLATGLSWQGSMLTARGDLAAAEESFDREESIRRALVAEDPGNADARVLLAMNATHRGRLAVMRGNLAAGREALGEARDLYRGVVDQDPRNLDWQRNLAESHLQLADLELVAEELPAATRSLAAVEEILAVFVEEDPSNEGWQRQLARSEALRARTALATGRLRPALVAAGDSRRRLDALLAERPGHGRILRALATSELVLGEALATTGDHPAAVQAWRRADGILAAQLTEAPQPELQALRAQVLLHLGELAEAEALVERLTAAGYARPDLLRLCRQHGLEVSAVAARAW